MDRSCGDPGYEGLITGLNLPDPDDRHVLAAAIVGRADVIVTRNLRDFPTEILATYGIAAQHPDEFVRHLVDVSPVLVVDTVREQQSNLLKPPVALAELLAVFERVGLVETVLELRRLMAI